MHIPPQNSLQHQLAHLCEQLLDFPRIGVTDDFFQLGGTPALANRLLDSIERTCGHRLPKSVLSEGLTISRLSEALLQKVPVSSSVWEIQPGAPDARCAFFFLHGDVSGGGFYTVELARSLGARLPFYVMEPHGLDGRDVPPTIEQMADDYLARLRSTRPAGPYYLGGLCSGALIAFEMARRLEQEGETVPRVFLVDPPFPQTEFLPASPKRPPQRSDWNKDLRLRGMWLFNSYLGPVRRYSPGSYNGKVLLMGSNECRFGREVRNWNEIQKIWQSKAAEVELRPIPGNHITCIGRHVRDLGRKMKPYLPEAC